MAARSRVRRKSRWLIALPWALSGAAIGLGFGVLAAGVAAMGGATVPRWLPLAVAALCGGTGWLLKALVIEGSGDVARRIYMGGDQGTAPEYSAARSLEVRGQLEPALEEYAAGALEYPEDPEPLLLGARLLAGPLDRPAEALEWLTRAREIPRLAAREEILIDREMVELYDGPLQDPARALPILARVAERHAGTKPAEWASRRLARLRTHVWADMRADEPEDTTRG